MKGSRTKDNDKARVIETKINTPDITLKEIQENTGVNYETARVIIKDDMGEVLKSSENIAKLIDTNNNLQSLADKLIADKLLKNEDTIRISELVTLRESTFKQNQLLQGKATVNVNVLWDVLKEIQGIE